MKREMESGIIYVREQVATIEIHVRWDSTKRASGGGIVRGLLFQHSPSSREESEAARVVLHFDRRERFRKRVGEHFIGGAID